eukprot:5755021-Prymnesium_polylepis.1
MLCGGLTGFGSLGGRPDFGQQLTRCSRLVHLLHLRLPANEAGRRLVGVLVVAHPFDLVDPLRSAAGQVALLGTVARELLGLPLRASCADWADVGRRRLRDRRLALRHEVDTDHLRSPPPGASLTRGFTRRTVVVPPLSGPPSLPV